MRRDEENLPIVGTENSSQLGARQGIDIHMDDAGRVLLDHSGMSVAPRWQDLDLTRIPRRLRALVPGALGANNTSCFRLGAGPFQRGKVNQGLELIPDDGEEPITHGVVAPVEIVHVAQYQQDLANTRTAWQIDED